MSSPPPGADRPPAAGDDPAAARRRRIGHYRLEGVIGRGGMGRVYQAWDERLHRRVALKVMLPEFASDLAHRERFLREARAAAGVAHDNVITIFDVGQDDDTPYLAMQLLEGSPLDGYLAVEGPPAIPESLRIAREVASGLAAAHAKGLIHRDIKPGNIWLEGADRRVKILDFGLALPLAAVDARLTMPGVTVGTPGCMSPEQTRGDPVDARTDLFSLGAVLYELVTGRPPFTGSSTMALKTAVVQDDPQPIPETHPHTPKPVVELVARLLAKDPAGRPATAADVVELIRLIERALGPTPPPIPSTDVTGAPPKPPPKPPPLVPTAFPLPAAATPVARPTPARPRKSRRRSATRKPPPRRSIRPWLIGALAAVWVVVLLLAAALALGPFGKTAPTTEATAPAKAEPTGRGKGVAPGQKGQGPWPRDENGQLKDWRPGDPIPKMPDGKPWPTRNGLPFFPDPDGWPGQPPPPLPPPPPPPPQSPMLATHPPASVSTPSMLPPSTNTPPTSSNAMIAIITA